MTAPGLDSRQRGSIREVATLAWPMIIGMLSYTVMGVTDTLVVGQLGRAELAGVGLATTAFFLVNSFFFGTLKGIKVVGSQAWGAGRHKEHFDTAWHGILLALPFGVLVLLLGIFDDVVIRLMNGTGEVGARACEYLSMRVWASPWWYVVIAAGETFQATGDSRTPMRFNIMLALTNVVLDIVLVFGLGPIPAMGVRGAALATTLACALTSIVALRTLFVRIPRPRELRLESFRRVLRYGLPIGVHFVTGVLGFTVFTAMLASVGEVALASHQVALRLVSVSFLPGHGVGEAASVLYGQYLGARNPDAARRAYRSSLKLAALIMGVCGLVFFLVPGPLVALFSTDAEVIAVTRQLLVVAAVFQLLDAVVMVSNGALNGAGKTTFTMWAGVGCAWLVLIPVAWFFIDRGWGAVGGWFGLTAEMLVLSLILVLRLLLMERHEMDEAVERAVLGAE